MGKNKELITAKALSEALHLSVETIWRYTREKKIPYIELEGKQYRYRLIDVMNSLQKKTGHETPDKQYSNNKILNEGSMVQEKGSPYEVESEKKLTYQDYLKLPEEPGYRYEILEGMLIKEPSPNVAHQRVSRRLQRILEDYFWNVDPNGEIFYAPLDVTFHDITVVQPDLFYVSGKQKEIIKDTRIDGVPTLVVEILSPSNFRKDRLQKMQIYQRVKVLHYWLVNPEEKTLECFSLRDGVYALVAAGMEDEIIESPDFNELSIDLAALW